MKYLLILCGLFISTLTFAQDEKVKIKPEFGGGVKVGLNFNQSNNAGFLDELKTNPLAGVYAYLNINKLGISIEGLWSTNTYTTDSNFNGLFNQYLNQGIDSTVARSFTFHNISIPVLLNYKLLDRLWIQAGPQFTTVASVIDKDDVVQSGKDIFYQGDISLIAGVQLRLVKNISVGGRYLFGISGTNNWNTTSQWENRQMQAYLCIGM